MPLSYGRGWEESAFYLGNIQNDASEFGWYSFRRGGVTEAANLSIMEERLLKNPVDKVFCY